jgi:hypothetical protein
VADVGSSLFTLWVFSKPDLAMVEQTDLDAAETVGKIQKLF